MFYHVLESLLLLSLNCMAALQQGASNDDNEEDDKMLM